MNGERKLVGALTGASLLLACYAALSRHLLPGIAAGWVDELVIYLSVWAMWLSGGLLVCEGAHIHADILERVLPPRLAATLARAGAILGLAFCALMTYAGALVVALSVQLGERSDSALALPLYWYYGGFPVGMALMAWRYWQSLSGAGGKSEAPAGGNG